MEKHMITNFTKSNELRKKANSLIPAGAHTYTKGDDQFPELSPHSIVRGKGARIWDVDGNEFVDWGMGLTSGLLGHAYEPVIDAIKKELDNGCNFIRPSFIEAEVAELMVNQIPCAEMVKFAKNGSDCTTAAVKLARAYTAKDIILRCSDQPFFSVHDWFMGNTVVDAGIPKSTKELTKNFKYNDIEDFKRVIKENESQGIACVIMEPVATEEPKEGYLQALKDICEANNIVLIFDEIISGFRFHPKGAQYIYGVTPHLATFGKAMANGYSISAVVGKKEIMELGGLEHDKERVFLLSTTYGGETHHLRAAQKTIEILNQNDYEVTKHIWVTGKNIKDSFNNLALKLGIDKFMRIEGIDCRAHFVFLDKDGNPDMVLRTLFLQEMIKHGVMMQLVVPSFSHGESEINQTLEAFDKVLKTLQYTIENNKNRELLVGNPVKPVFRKYN
jgi:glutamate-1-semialdehyde 2,1-aminomutase